MSVRPLRTSRRCAARTDLAAPLSAAVISCSLSCRPSIATGRHRAATPALPDAGGLRVGRLADVETDDVLALLKHVADEVVNPRFGQLASGDVSSKSHPGDLVTVADREAEVAIAAELRAAYPDALLLGEEATAADSSLPEQFRSAEHAFTIDPVDGTRNFVKGSPDHALMVSEVARRRRGAQLDLAAAARGGLRRRARRGRVAQRRARHASAAAARSCAASPRVAPGSDARWARCASSTSRGSAAASTTPSWSAARPTTRSTARRCRGTTARARCC